MIVLDTNVVSEIFRPSPEVRVIEWLASLTGDVAITVASSSATWAAEKKSSRPTRHVVGHGSRRGTALGPLGAITGGEQPDSTDMVICTRKRWTAGLAPELCEAVSACSLMIHVVNPLKPQFRGSHSLKCVILKRWVRPVLPGVLAGALTGFILGLMAYLGSNPAFRSYGGWSAFSSLTLGGAAIGVVVSTSSLLTAMIFVAAVDRRLVGPSHRRIRWASWGAAVGASGYWIISGVAGALSIDDWSWFAAYVVAAVVSAIIAGILSAVIVSRAERRSAEASATS